MATGILVFDFEFFIGDRSSSLAMGASMFPLLCNYRGNGSEIIQRKRCTWPDG
jgi:hypothetical protein